MKYLLILTLLFASCSTYISSKTEGEIRDAATAYLKNEQNTVGGMRVTRNDATYRVMADVTLPDGTRKTRVLLIRQYDSDAGYYWKVDTATR